MLRLLDKRVSVRTHRWVACGAGRRGGGGRRVVVSKPINVQKDVHRFNYTLPAERVEAEEGGKQLCDVTAPKCFKC